MTQTPKRLAPKMETLRELFLKSGNLCAFPGCNAMLMDEDGTFIGQLCHIEAAELGGERFNPSMTNDERRSAANLMLMCYPHHRITNDVERYTAEYLRGMKAAHEARFAAPDRAMRERVANAKWTTLVGASLVAGVALGDMARGLRSLFGSTRSNQATSFGGTHRSELLRRLRLAPIGVVRFYTRDPVHAAVGDEILEMFQAAGWTLEQINGIRSAVDPRRVARLTDGMLLIFEVQKAAEVSNADKAIHGFFDALGFTVAGPDLPAERADGDYTLRFFLVVATRAHQ